MPFKPANSSSWWISYTDASGQRIRESARTSSKTEARALETSRRAEVRRVTVLGETQKRTVDEVLLQYLKDTASKKTHDRDLASARPVTKKFKGRYIDSLAPTDFTEYKSERRQAGKADATWAKELLLLSAAINWCNSEHDWKLPNPTKGRIPQFKRNKLRWLRSEEAAALIAEAAKNKRAKHLVDFVELALATGMRRDEMLMLTWARVDFGARMIYFDAADQKSGQIGSIPLNKTAVEILRRRQAYRDEHCRKSPWVFCHSDGERLQSVKNSFWAVTEALKMPDVTPHTLRHTFAARLVQAGVPLRTVKDLMRHADIRTTMIYAHLADENTRSAVELLDRYDQNMTAQGNNRSISGVS